MFIQPRPSGEKIAAIAEKLDLKKNVVRVSTKPTLIEIFTKFTFSKPDFLVRFGFATSVRSRKDIAKIC